MNGNTQTDNCPVTCANPCCRLVAIYCKKQGKVVNVGVGLELGGLSTLTVPPRERYHPPLCIAIGGKSLLGGLPCAAVSIF